MKKLIFTLLTTLLFSVSAYSQQYETAIGFRGGFFSGVTAKHFIGQEKLVEGILSSRWRGFTITGLLEFQKPAFEVENLYWYYGFGAHIGFFDGVYTTWASENVSYTVVGIDGILGMEYVFEEVPISLSLDWKPVINLIGYSGFWGDGGALSVRYYF